MSLGIGKRVALAGVAVLAILFIAVLALYLRLTQGPMAASFLNARIEKAISAELPDMHVKLGDAFVAIDPKSGAPHITFDNIMVRDQAGNLIASAPQAALNLNTAELLTGTISARSLELIGPRISARRNVDGSLVLGFNAPSDEAATQATADAEAPAKANPDGTPGVDAKETTGGTLLNLLDQHDTKNTISALEDIRISGAAINFYDDGNAATWFAPKADLTFQKKPYGFVILAKADVATNAKPWHAEVSATYKHDTKKFEISSTLDNLVPTSVARKIFALSQFAALSTPLSGHVDLGVDADGRLLAATGEFQASAGRVTLPDVFAEPIAIDEGVVRVAYDPQTTAFSIANSSLVVGGRRLDLAGSVQPQRGQDGKLSALAIKLATSKSQNQPASQDTKADAKGDATPALIDHIEFSGSASVDKARLDVDDLVVMSGNTGLRMRGNITGGEKSPGIHLAGRIRDVSDDLLKLLWPPIVAPRSRAWIAENVVDGRIPEGTFQINFDENALAAAKAAHLNPPGSLDFKFSLANVTTHYFKSLPNLQNGAGQAHLQDNSFNLDIDTGFATLDSGETIKLVSGSFEANDLQAPIIQGLFKFELEAPVPAMLAVATNPDLKMFKPDALANVPKATGLGHVKLELQMPLVKDPPKEEVQLKTDLNASNVEIAGLAPGVDLTEGNFNINVTQEKIDIAGPAKINGQPAKLTWSKPREGGVPVSTITTTLDDKSREKLGLKLSDYLNGPVDVAASMSKDDSGAFVFDVKADLSQANMHLAAIGWNRDPTPGTTSSFRLISTDQGRSVRDFKLDGDGLHLKGAIELFKDGKLKAVSMNEIRLDEDNVFSVRAIPGDGTTDLTVTGTNLDARPYIKAVLSPPPPAKGTPAGQSAGQDFTMRAHFDKVIANRGEILNNVSATLRSRAGRIAEANIQGTFVNGQPITATVVPLPQGREMRLKSSDAGSAMRAANFYSKIAGGNINFYALIGNEQGSPLRNGNLTISNFEVRNEATLADLDKRGKPQKSGPRSEAVFFSTLYLPFSSDDKFIRFKDGTVRGPTMCATADGVIRKADNALDISGTVVPACGLSRALNNVPLIGDLLSGGNYNEGIFGVTYAMGGTFAEPKIQMNPISALAPGIFRRLFDFNPKAAAPDVNGKQP
ncbi:MAG: hypothetical protein KGO53_01580 [Alphaproteobacteria bacterium]|nr:hypothetical protein [Alphaproteobacteria bacterium]